MGPLRGYLFKSVMQFLLLLLLQGAHAQEMRMTGMMNGPVYALESYGLMLVAGGRFDTIDSQQIVAVAGWDGVSWKQVGSGLVNEPGDATKCYALHIFDGLLFIGGEFHIAGGNPYNQMLSFLNGPAWATSLCDSNNHFCMPVTAIKEYGGCLYAAGEFCSIQDTCNQPKGTFIAYWDGMFWKILDPCATSSNSATTVVNSMAVYDGSLYMAVRGFRGNQNFYDILAAWNGNSFSILSAYQSGEGHEITSLAVYNNILYGTVSNGYFARWTGASWDTSSINTGIEYGVNKYLYGSYGGYLYARNGERLIRWDGFSWYDFSLRIPAPNVLHLHDGILYGGYDQGVYSLSDSIGGINEGCYPAEIFFYPNPVWDLLNVRYDLKETSRISIRIYNALGMMVSELLDKEQHTGKHRLSFDMRALSPGAYLVEVGSQGRIIKKAILHKH